MGGMDLDATDAGSGFPVILLHGFPLDRSIWGPRGPFRFILPDLRGHGATPAADSATMDDQARDVLELMDCLKIDRAAIAGHSMGGYVLFALNRLAPERIAAGLFVSTRAAADTGEGRRARETGALRALAEGPGFLAESMIDRLFAPGARPEVTTRIRAVISRSERKGVAAALRGMASRPDSTPDLPRFDKPALVIAGRGDRIVPVAESEAMAAAIPKSRLEIFDRSGHMPMMEEPERFWDVVGDFLSHV